MKNRLLILLSLVLLLGCSRKNEEVIKIGVILPLTGPAGEIGNSILDGINLAFENLPPPERKFKLIIEDSKLDPKQGINAANKLISIDKVKTIIGLASSPVALAVAPVCEQNKVLMISSTASTPKLSESGEYIFRIYPSDVYDGEILADFAVNKLNAKTSSILYLNNDFGVGLRNSFKTNFTKLKGTIEKEEAFLSEDISFRTQLTNIKKSNSKTLLAIAIDMQYENIIKQIRELNIESKILAPVTFDNPKIIQNLGDAANGIFYTRPLYDINSSEEIVQKFKNTYQTKFNSEPALLSAMGYDSFLVIFESLSKSKFDFSLVLNYLYSTEFSGASGKFKFDTKGDVIREIEIMEIIDNKVIRYEK